ncbi:MAG: tetratricopeptide repeat protein [Bacteroidales bacterium]|nr:tetratricopeptide repeat protein [Bacteroidales bacterium]
MKISNNKSTRALILIMGAFALIAVLIAKFYYKGLNNSVDTRIVEARKLYEQYNTFAQQGEFDSVFWLMDTVEFMYSHYEHYEKSYEVGVLYNNRAAAWLTMMLHVSPFKDSVPLKDSLVNLANDVSQYAIDMYSEWIEKYGQATEEELEQILTQEYLPELTQFDETTQQNFFKNRVKEIKEAQLETSRRLSVSYTNMGVVHRYNERYKESAKCYHKALELWDQNLTAENNLNSMLGRPLRKRTFIQKMFPPKRK